MTTILVYAAVLLAAALHAGWNAVVKAGGDGRITLAAVTGVSTGVGLLLLPFVPVPASASWPFIALSTLFHTGYYVFLAKAYRHGDLNQVYPLARGAAPMMIALSAWILAGETLDVLAVAGVLIASTGIALLAFEPRRGHRSDRRALRYGLGTAVWIAAYTLSDGLGVRAAGHSLAYIVWLFAIEGWPFILYVVFRHPGATAAHLRQWWPRCLGGGLAASCAYGIVIFALGIAPMAAVSALRETSVIMAAVIGAAVLGEPLGRWRTMAAIVVCAGAALVTMYRG